MDKAEFYRMLNQQLLALCDGEDDWLANLANASALLFTNLTDINWAGFYLLRGSTLKLGPFQGKPACTSIPVGRGVCGTAVAQGRTIVVADVHQFSGHIACDAASRSEIVVPLQRADHIVGVLDIDSPITNRFDQQDATGLEEFAQNLTRLLLWPTP